MRIKLILKRILNIFICSNLFRSSSTSANLNETLTHMQEDNIQNINNPHELAALQKSLDELIEAHNNRPLSDSINNFHNNFAPLNRQAERFIDKLKTSHTDNNQIIDQMVNISNDSNFSLKSIVGVFDFVSKNKDYYIKTNIASDVEKQSKIREAIKQLQSKPSNDQGNQASNLVSQASEVKTTIKPLGNAGDTTINELLVNFYEKIEPIIEYAKEHPELTNIFISAGNISLRVLTPLLVYRSVVRIFNKTLPIPNINSLNQENYLKARNERFVILTVAAPLVTAALINSVLPPLSSLSKQSKTEALIEEVSDQLKDKSEIKKELSLMSILSFKGNKKFNWKKLLSFLFLFFTLVILKSYNIDILDYIYTLIQNPTFGKYLFLVFIFITLILILRYLLIILLIYLINKNKINKSIFLPSFFNKMYNSYEKVSRSKDLEYMLAFYYKCLYISFILFFSSLIYFLIFF